ncbi:hypothetical protein ABPG75_002429 [Micractinium tetrahymenae]
MQVQGSEAAEVPPPPLGALPEAAATAAEALAATLAATPPATMSQSAAAVAAGPPLGALPPPSLTDCILCDHSQTLTLFNHFFQAAQTGNALVMDMCVCALALDMRLHSQAENMVLYPLLEARLGEAGLQWAARELAEHGMLEQSIADVLSLRTVGGQALMNRMKQAQAEFLTHQAEEEGQILPAVAAVLTAEESITLAAQFKAAKQSAPLAPQIQDTLAQATQAASAAAAAHQAAAAHAAGPTPGRTVTTGMEMGGDVGSPEGGEMEMAGAGGAEFPEPPPAGSKAAEAGVTGAFVMEAEA